MGRLKEFVSQTKDTIVEGARKKGSELKEWKDEFKESLQLNTVEKWKMIMQRGKENWMLKWKDYKINREDENIRSTQEKIETKKEAAKKDEESFSKAIENVDPSLKGLFEHSQETKKGETASEVKKMQDSIPEMQKRKNETQEQKGKLEEKIKGIETDFKTKIDEKIEKIKVDNGLEEKLEKKKEWDGEVQRLGENVKTSEENLARFEGALKHKELLTKADRKVLEGMAKTARNELEKNKKILQRAENVRNKIDQQINGINKRTKKYEDMKKKYGLEKDEEKKGGATEKSEGSSSENSKQEKTELDKEELEQIERLCDSDDVEELKKNRIPGIKIILGQMGAMDKSHPLHLAYRIVNKEIQDEEIKDKLKTIRNLAEVLKEDLE